MNALRILCLAACLVATVVANQRSNSLRDSMRPSEWLSPNQLEQLPSVEEITFKRLEDMSTHEGAELLDKIYHLAKMNYNLEPTYAPKPSEIPASIVTPNGQRVQCKLNELVAKAKQQPNFGDQEVTILITGLPSECEAAQKANRKLVQAYMQRYNYQQNWQGQDDQENTMARTSSEEDYSQKQRSARKPTGDLIVIELGQALNSFKNMFMLDVDQTGAMIGKILVRLTEEADVPQEMIHVLGQGVAAHVAGAAGRQYARLTGHQLRRITALDPSKIAVKKPNTLTGLTRGDAEFVDAIHTSAYGLGTSKRVGNVDFYPNGPNVAAPGAQNLIEASMRATRYFAESVRPGNERNFPAVAASSLKEYKNNEGYGPRAYMGIDTDYDIEGDYILQVNSKCPFGKREPAQLQYGFHHGHQSWNQNTEQNE